MYFSGRFCLWRSAETGYPNLISLNLHVILVPMPAPMRMSRIHYPQLSMTKASFSENRMRRLTQIPTATKYTKHNRLLLPQYLDSQNVISCMTPKQTFRVRANRELKN